MGPEAAVPITMPATAPAAPATPAAPTSAAAPPAGPPPIPVQVAQQLGRHLSGTRTLADGTHTTVMKLSPERLGEVTIKLDVRDGGVRMELIAAPQALSALQDDLGRLRDQLAQSGLDLGDVSFSQPQESSANPDSRPQQPAGPPAAPPGRASRGSAGQVADLPTDPTENGDALQNGRFDVRV